MREAYMNSEDKPHLEIILINSILILWISRSWKLRIVAYNKFNPQENIISNSKI